MVVWHLWKFGDTRIWLLVGLTLIAIGSGGIKPCVSSHVGDQFCSKNKHLISKVFGWFYFSINFGAFASGLMTFFAPSDQRRRYHWRMDLSFRFRNCWAQRIVRANLWPSLYLRASRLLMALATFLFWMGRKDFAHSSPWKEFSRKPLVNKTLLLSVEFLQFLPL